MGSRLFVGIACPLFCPGEELTLAVPGRADRNHRFEAAREGTDTGAIGRKSHKITVPMGVKIAVGNSTN